jgi:hypothetical protein
MDQEKFEEKMRMIRSQMIALSDLIFQAHALLDALKLSSIGEEYATYKNRVSNRVEGLADVLLAQMEKAIDIHADLDASLSELKGQCSGEGA